MIDERSMRMIVKLLGHVMYELQFA